MANSEVVRKSASSKSSMLVKAMKGWTTNQKVFTEKPHGVFGSKAIIRCNGAVIKSDELDIEFTVPFDDDMEANEAEITIYNLSNTTKNRLKRKQRITIEAGFGNDIGVIFKGYIEKPITKFDGVDRKTTLTCVDRLSKTTLKEITYKKGTKASKILKDLIDKTGTPIAVFKVKRDFTYKDEQKIDGDLYENIKRLAEVCGISVYVNKGKVYARTLKEGDALNFTLQESTGLIGSPTEYEEEISAEKYKDVIKGYDIETLLQHRFTTAGIIKLKSRDVSGQFRIRSGSHSFNNGEAITKIKVY